jgi:ABC-type lipoprotein export system ATPase subunit
MSEPNQDPLVALAGVRTEAVHPYDSGLAADSFSLRGGELAVVEIARENSHSPFADIVSGVHMAEAGEAKFAGLDWRTASADLASRARSRIGRIFDGTSIHWLSNLDLDENLTLPYRFHNGPLTAEVQTRLEQMATLAGCWPLPTTRPSVTPKNVLRRAEWVRAFLSNPSLLILERPLREIGGDTAGLSQLVRDALKRGAAILLVTRDSDPWQSLAPQPAAHWKLHAGRLERKS